MKYALKNRWDDEGGLRLLVLTHDNIHTTHELQELFDVDPDDSHDEKYEQAGEHDKNANLK